MIEVKLVKAVLKLRDIVCNYALKSINRKSANNIKVYNNSVNNIDSARKALHMRSMQIELAYTEQDNEINAAYREVTKLATK